MKRHYAASLCGAAAILFSAMTGAAAGVEKETISKPCINCHKAKDMVVRGKLTNLSNKAATLQVGVGKAVWLFDFDDMTAFKNVDGIQKLKKNKEVAIRYEKKGAKLYAGEISTKPRFEVPEKMLVDTEYVLELVKKSPADGGYVLIDARPGPKFEEGHIEYARSMPLPAFEKKKDTILPPDKDMVVIFYCGGVT